MDNLDDVNGLLDYSDGSADLQSPAVVSPGDILPAIPAQSAAPAAEMLPPALPAVPVSDSTPVDLDEDELDEDLDDEDLDDDDLVDERHPMVYRMRRAAIRTVLIAGVALLALFAVVQTGSTPKGSSQTPERASENAVVAPPSQEELKAATQQVQTMVGRAVAWQVQKDSFTGFEAEGARVASSDTVLVLSMVVDGHCYYGGVIPGQNAPVMYDETGKACTDAMIKETQASLDAQAAQVRNDNQGEAANALSRAVETVQYYANSNFVGGKPSFEGMTSTSVDGVTIVDTTPTSVVLQAHSGPECLVTEVTSDSSTEPVVADCQG